MIKMVHRIAAITASLCIAIFFTSTAIVELFGSHASIAIVKRLIVLPGLIILVPAIALAGGTGFVLSGYRKGGLVKSKKRRMPFIGANGLLILLPTAIILDQMAASGSFGAKFYLFQTLELMAGMVNLILMAFNIRDGLKMSGKLSPEKVKNRKAGSNQQTFLN
jgi:hypothetical protein